MNTAQIYLYTDQNEILSENKIIYFTFENEVFYPGTIMNFKILSSFKYGDIKGNINKAVLYVNEDKIHSGYIKNIELKKYGDFLQIIGKSEGFTSLLAQNFLKPGLYPDITCSDIVLNYVQIPEVTAESDYQKSYVYIEDGKSVWDGVESLCYNLYKTFPYITDCNKVNFKPADTPKIIIPGSTYVLEMGKRIDTDSLFSEIFEQDIDKNYDTYTFKNQKSLEMNIYRRREIPLDMRFLRAPETALSFRNDKAVLKAYRKFIKYNNYYSMQLWDRIEYEDVVGRVVNIKITGSKNGIFSKIEVK